MAKLRPEQLTANLNSGLAPIYIVSGDEPLLVQECCQQIRQAAMQAGFNEREVHNSDSGFDWSHLLHAATSMSLFADKKIIELNIKNGKPGTEGGQALQEYAKLCSSDNILLMIMPKLDASQQRSKWFKAIEAPGRFVQIWPVKSSQLPSWVGQRLRQSGLQASDDAIAVLCSRIEGNLLAAVQEIEKLKLLSDDGKVSTELMASVVADSARYDIFDLADKVLLGQTEAAVKTLQGLRSEGTDAIPILWALAREIRSLNQIAHAQQQGQHFSAAAKQAGVWDKRQPLVQAALKRLSPPQLELLLRKANGVDKAVKGMRNADAWSELLDLVLASCSLNSIHPSLQRLSLSL